MPVSSDIFRNLIMGWLANWEALGNSHDYYDIGAGAGKYGRLVRQVDPQAYLVGIEIDPEYIETFHLGEIYHSVVCANALDHFIDQTDLDAGIFFMGDVIEHMRKSEGLDLLHYLVYHCRYVLITFPTAYKQGAWEGHKSEAHRSSWSQADFSWVKHHYFTEVQDNVPINLCIVKGYIDAPDWMDP